MTTLEQARKAKRTLLEQLEHAGRDVAVGIGRDASGFIVKVHAEKASLPRSLPKMIGRVKVTVEVTGRAKALQATH